MRLRSHIISTQTITHPVTTKHGELLKGNRQFKVIQQQELHNRLYCGVQSFATLCVLVKSWLKTLLHYFRGLTGLSSKREMIKLQFEGLVFLFLFLDLI